MISFRAVALPCVAAFFSCRAIPGGFHGTRDLEHRSRTHHRARSTKSAGDPQCPAGQFFGGGAVGLARGRCPPQPRPVEGERRRLLVVEADQLPGQHAVERPLVAQQLHGRREIGAHDLVLGRRLRRIDPQQLLAPGDEPRRAVVEQRGRAREALNVNGQQMELRRGEAQQRGESLATANAAG